MVRGHVVLLAGVGTVGGAVPLGLTRRHRPLQVWRLVLRQCGLPSEIAGPALVGGAQTMSASARDEKIVQIYLVTNGKLSTLANTNIFF